jgi:hypothetical protein
VDKWEKVVLLDRMLHSRKYCIPLKAILEELECSQATFHRIRTFMQTNLGAPIEFDQRYKGYRYKTENGVPFEPWKVCRVAFSAMRLRRLKIVSNRF